MHLLAEKLSAAAVAGLLVFTAAPAVEAGDRTGMDDYWRVERLAGVEHAGVYFTVRIPEGVAVTSSPRAAADSAPRTKVVAASPGVLEAAEPTLVEGRLYDAFAERSAAPATVTAAPLVGPATGLPAGLCPAVRAARTEPVEALRR